MNVKDIKDPKFLNKLSNRKLETLSSDIREFIINSISKTGGHLSSNLGVVELTIAIHKVFDSPKDKIFFDVGHQAYVHKILTGRAKKFNTLRKSKGLSGYLKLSESPHDCWEAGHTSTSLSGAIGAAVSRDLDNKKFKVIAVIGDGAMTGGMAYEALNYIGGLNKNIIVILNDNNMSISKNVGALHNSLEKIRISKKYLRNKIKIKKYISKVPLIGSGINKFITATLMIFKNIYNKKGIIFRDLGFKYFGPINGHDFDDLLSYLNASKKLKGPVLLHVITEKGKGYDYAENDEIGSWHGTAPFDIKSGERKKKTTELISWSKVISKNLLRLAQKDKDIVVITPAMKNGSALDIFEEKFPKRFFDVGIAEEHAVTMAASMALNGKKPFISIYSTFLQRAYDQVLHDVSRMNAPVIIGIDRAGIVGEDGETHQGLFDISFLSHIPNINIVMPKDSVEAANLLYTAFKINKPIAIRYPRGNVIYKEIPFKKIPYGSWEKLDDGNDGYIITYGSFINQAMEINRLLEKDNKKLSIINARFIKPFDVDMFDEILKDDKLIYIYEETMKVGGLGSLLLEYISEKDINIKIKLFSINDRFVYQGTYHESLVDIKLDAKTIYNKIKKQLT